MDIFASKKVASHFISSGVLSQEKRGLVKKSGILNREISRVLATMGHYDFLVVADAGLPIPKDADCIDHLSIKDKVRTAKAVIRTGDFSPYSNTILSCGVSFSKYEQRITGK